ncbi:hypothetical protein ONZ51_g12995 [Trametes cubensis]|uniref:Uncharacterized protein n=1 Tax=Trametes cubensis TaxID=1111947 RepID=A0AAD7X3B5_9APHY|nr:hypothetical protein ONZ51_g12995 [Trametes cubensis]
MVNVANIPTDIWRIILPLACTDGGSTGKSLVLTSTFFYTEASPFRFYSLAFDTLARSESFLAFVRRQPGGFRPQITHLYISHSDYPDDRFRWSWRTVVKMTEAERARYRRTIQEEKVDWANRFRTAFDALIHLAAPNLCTLCVAEHCAPVVIRCFLPKLEELTWTGFTFLPGADVHSGPTSEPPARVDGRSNTLPTLKRIHVVLGKTRPISSAILRPLHVAADTLTHVRISNVDMTAMSMDLAGALVPSFYTDVFGQSPPASLFPPLALPALREVTIQNTSGGEFGVTAVASQPPTGVATVRTHNFGARDGGDRSHIPHRGQTAFGFALARPAEGGMAGSDGWRTWLLGAECRGGGHQMEEHTISTRLASWVTRPP